MDVTTPSHLLPSPPAPSVSLVSHVPSYELPTMIPVAPVPSPLCITHDTTPTPPPTLSTCDSDHLYPKIQASHFPNVASGVHVPAKAKRSHLLAFPSSNDTACKQAKTNTQVGMSKQAIWKRKILEQINNGTWIADPKKWATYKSKLIKLDRHFEVLDNPCLACYVKHSRCGSWIIMSLPYDVGRFKTHINSRSYSTASGGMKTLDGYGILVRPMSTQPSIPSAPSSSSSTDLPCLSRLTTLGQAVGNDEGLDVEVIDVEQEVGKGEAEDAKGE